jgi:1-acyl-sn-glycerol-3-phosphate acyltransferase
VLPIFSLGYWLFGIITLPILFVVALVIFVVTRPFDRRGLVFHMFSCFWGSFYIYMNPLWRMRIVGRERLPWRGPAVIAANHASLVDILVLYGLYRPFKWVAKASLFRIPVIGWNMWLNGYVSLERGDRESIRSMMEQCQKLLAQGWPILIFPEGTRTETGELQRFKDGAFRLALEAGCPVFPVVVKGTYDTLPKHGIVFRNRMDAHVEVLEPLDPAKFDSVDALRDATRVAIAAALSR